MKKSKKLLALLLAGAMVGSLLTGCGSKEKTEETSVESNDTYKIAMITNAAINDGGWNSTCYANVTEAATAMDWETAYADNVAQTDYVNMFREYANMGFSIIFAPGNEYTDAIKEVAPDFPNVSFVLLNGDFSDTNVTSVLPDATQIGYLAGAMAGLVSKTNNIGFIGGMELTTTMQKLEGFEKAAQTVNPDIKVSSSMAGSFDDTAKGKEIASSMISTNDVDVLFGDASAVDTGAREALHNEAGRYQIGQPGDIAPSDTDYILTSVCSNNASLIEQCMEEFESGNFGGKIIEGDLASGCLTIGTFGACCDKETQDRYMEIVEQIKNGTFITE